MRVLLCPFGSHGDVHPFVGLGKGLQERGHDVQLIAAEPFRKLSERVGLPFVGLGTTEEYDRMANNPLLWHPRKGLQVIFRNDTVGRIYREQFEHIQQLNKPGETVLVAGTLGFAARVAQEVLQIPYVTIHLQPIVLFSVQSPAIYPKNIIRSWWPHWLRRGFYHVGDAVTDIDLKPELNKFRKSLSLAPVKKILRHWSPSAQRIVGLFPPWYAHAADWPSQLVQAGFIRHDQAEMGIPLALEQFLKAGEPPVAFSFGSAMRTGRPYFEAAAKACEIAKCRGLILAKGGEQIPPHLPPNVFQCDYAPFSQVFPRCSLVVHHGGIGTTAQCLAAGVPQVIMPLAFDQPDNANRITQLGVGTSILPKKFTAKRVAKLIQTVTVSETVRAKCQEFQRKMETENAMAKACEAIEGALRG